MTFDSHPCFSTGHIGVFTRGEACATLSAAIARIPEAQEAFVALGDPADPARRARALAVLNGLPDRTRAALAKAEGRP